MLMRKDIGLMLYWAEGDKANKAFVALTNSNPNVLKYFVTWFRKYYKIDGNKLKCRLYIWEDLDEERAKDFWSKLLKISKNNFTKSYIQKKIPKIRKNKHEFGVCRVGYCSTKTLKLILKEIDILFVQ